MVLSRLFFDTLKIPLLSVYFSPSWKVIQKYTLPQSPLQSKIDFTSCCGQSCSSINWIVQKFFKSFNILESSAISSQCWCHIIGKTAWLVMCLTTKGWGKIKRVVCMICWHRAVSAFYQSVFSQWRYIVYIFVKLIPNPLAALMYRQRVL